MSEVHFSAGAQCFRLGFSRPLASFELVNLLMQVEGAQDAGSVACRLNVFATDHEVDLASVQPIVAETALASANELRNRFL